MAHRLLTRFLPFLAWWPLTPLILRADLLAGVIGALVQVPKAMAYAQLAGLPLQYGLYAAFVPAIIGALWGSSRHLATGPVAVVSLMTAAAVTPLAVPGSEDYIGLVLLLTLMVGCIQFVLGVVKLGSAVNFVSHPVILGFMNAAAIIIRAKADIQPGNQPCGHAAPAAQETVRHPCQRCRANGVSTIA